MSKWGNKMAEQLHEEVEVYTKMFLDTLPKGNVKTINFIEGDIVKHKIQIRKG